MSEWKPGGVQVVLSMHPSRVQEFATWLHRQGESKSLVRDIAAQINEQGHGARLVVIDPEDREQVERLYRLYVEATGVVHKPQRVTSVQAALREFANPTPPKPPQPENFAAIVIDSHGVAWSKRADYAWNSADGDIREYADIDAVRVLSEGVQA